MIDQVLCMHDGKPQWRNAGNWGLLTWDHQLPGPIIGTKMYVIHMPAGWTGYPSSGTAEIRVRDFADRTNHTFTTYAKLDQIASEGYLSDRCGLFAKDGYLYLSVVKSIFSDNVSVQRTIITKMALYRLDSVTSDSVGVFTRVGDRSVGTGVTPGSDIMESMTYGAMGTTNACYRWAYGHWYFDSSSSYITKSFVDSYAPGTHYYKDDQRTISTFALSPFLGSLDYSEVKLTKTFKPRAIGYTSTPVIYQMASYDIVVTGLGGLTGVSMSDVASIYSTGQLSGSGVIPEYSYANPLTAHPISINSLCDYAMWWGSYSTLTNYNAYTGSGSKVSSPYIASSMSRSKRDIAIPTITDPAAISTLAGIIGPNFEAKVVNAYGNYNRNVYSEFYVNRTSDPSGVSRCSIFSTVLEDGSIMHIEGLEDPTPTLWIDNTFVGNLN